jgi:uncharacterized membrane protein
MQKRYFSKVAWVAIATLVLFVLKNWGLLTPLGLTETSYNELVDAILAILIAFGVFNNPTDVNHY